MAGPVQAALLQHSKCSVPQLCSETSLTPKTTHYQQDESPWVASAMRGQLLQPKSLRDHPGMPDATSSHLWPIHPGMVYRYRNRMTAAVKVTKVLASSAITGLDDMHLHHSPHLTHVLMLESLHAIWHARTCSHRKAAYSCHCTSHRGTTASQQSPIPVFNALRLMVNPCKATHPALLQHPRALIAFTPKWHPDHSRTVWYCTSWGRSSFVS